MIIVTAVNKGLHEIWRQGRNTIIWSSLKIINRIMRVDTNVYWDKMDRFLLCFDDRSIGIYLLGWTEENYINTKVINSFKFSFCNMNKGGKDAICDLLRRLLVILARLGGSGAWYGQVRGRYGKTVEN